MHSTSLGIEKDRTLQGFRECRFCCPSYCCKLVYKHWTVSLFRKARLFGSDNQMTLGAKVNKLSNSFSAYHHQFLQNREDEQYLLPKDFAFLLSFLKHPSAPIFLICSGSHGGMEEGHCNSHDSTCHLVGSLRKRVCRPI